MKYPKLLAASALALALSMNLSANEARIVATVNNEVITSFDVEQALNSGVKNSNEAFSNLVQQKLIISLAKRFKISANELEINDELKKIKSSSHISDAEFAKLSEADKSLAIEHARFEVYKNKLFDHIAANYGPKEITDEQARKFFDENVAGNEGADFRAELPKIKAYLFNQGANEAIHNFIAKEQAKAKVIMKDKQ